MKRVTFVNKYLFSFFFLFGITTSIFLFLNLQSCKNPTAPKGNNPPDTTSHNFTWTQYEFGSQQGPSNFKDVAIVNDSDIWAVGEIHTNDSIYNAVHWDGKEWELKQIMFPLCDANGNQQGFGSYPANSIFAFLANDIWITCNVSLVHWDDQNFKPICITMGYGQRDLGKIWGIKNQLYFIGTDGFIAMYSNSMWTQFESGTTIDLRDVWGSSDGKTVWACGYSNDYGSSVLLKYYGNTWATLWLKQPSSTSPPYEYFISSLWASDNYLYVAADIGIFRTSLKGNYSTQKVLTLSSGPHSIRGSADNNIAIALDDGSIWHYNGTTWFKETNSGQLKPLYSIAVSKNTIVAVGFDATNINWQGLLLIGRRN